MKTNYDNLIPLNLELSINDKSTYYYNPENNTFFKKYKKNIYEDVTHKYNWNDIIYSNIMDYSPKK